MRALWVSLAVCTAVVACSSTETSTSSGSSPSSSSGGAACGKAGRAGTTPDCGAFTCSAGQYCVSGFPALCKNGCTSDNNCGETERCVRCGTQTVGTCQPCSRSEADACNVPTVDAGPKECERDTFLDQTDCGHPGPSGMRPPIGYRCPDTATVPKGKGCVQGDLAIDWCCPQ